MKMIIKHQKNNNNRLCDTKKKQKERSIVSKTEISKLKCSAKAEFDLATRDFMAHIS